MTGSAARVGDLHELARIWQRRGLRVLEMPGWEDRGREAGNTFEVVGVHHTAAADDVDRILRDGRPDVSGPLCNVALHANGDVVLVASGRANHFGVATWPSMRTLGVEATGPPFTNYAAYVELAAGFCEWMSEPPTEVIRVDTTIPVYVVAAHKEVAQPYGRKPNPAGEGFNNGGRLIAGVQLVDDFRRDIAAALTEEDELPFTEDQLRAMIRDEVRNALVSRPAKDVTAGSLFSKVVDIQGGVDRIEPLTLAMKTRLEAVESDMDVLVERREPPA